MSVVNTMLRELAERQQNGATPTAPQVDATPALGIKATPARAGLPWWFFAVLALAVLILVWRLWLSSTAVSTDTRHAASAANVAPSAADDAIVAASNDSRLKSHTITVPAPAPAIASTDGLSRNGVVVPPPTETNSASAPASIGWELVSSAQEAEDQWPDAVELADTASETEIETATAQQAQPHSESLANPSVATTPTGQQPQTARNEPVVFERALAQLSPVEQLEQLRAQARAALAVGDLATAAQAIDRGLQLQATDGELQTLQLDWLNRQSPEQAERHAQQLLQRQPDNVSVRQWLGAHYLQQQQAQRAIETLQAQAPALTQAPDYHGVLALAEQQTGQHQAAAKRYLQLTQLQPQHGRHWAGLALSQESLGQPAEAIRAWRLALRDAALPAALARFAEQRLQRLQANALSSQVSP